VPLRRVLAFGSFARGDMHELSDLDLVVVGDFEGPRQLRGLAVRDVAWDLGLDVPIEVVPHRRRSSSVRGTDGSSSTSCPRRSISRSIRADAPVPHPTLCSAAHFGRGRRGRACGRRGRESGGPLLPRSTFLALLSNGLTTVVGFGSLMTAAHRGIFGLGLLLALGMIATLGASLIVLPVLLAWTEPRVIVEPTAVEPSEPARAAA